MKKTFKMYIAIWAVLLAVFNVAAFLLGGLAGPVKYSVSFWVGYAFITLAFIGQLVCAHIAFKAENQQKMFYNLSLLVISAIGLALTFVFGVVCMVVPALPYWVGIIVCVLVLGVTAAAVLSAKTAVDTVSQVDEKVKNQTFFIRSLTVDAESLVLAAKDEPARQLCKKVYEAVRYSDPVSHAALAATESAITLKFSAFSQAVQNGENAETLAKELLVLINERNKKCQLLK